MRQLTRPSIRICIRLILLLFSITPTIYAVFTKSNCTEFTAHTQCQCSNHRPLAYDIACQKGKNVLTVTIQRLRKEDEQPHVILDCNHIDAREYSVLRAIDIGNSSFVQIKRCQLSAVLSTQFFDSVDTSSIFIYNSSLEVNYTRKDFSVLSGLKTLTLKFFDLSLMPKDLFMDLIKLIALRLSYAKVELSRNIFARLENLETLILDHNNLLQLPAGIFRNQRNLRELNLSHNRLGNLSRSVFKGASSLSTLDLSFNFETHNNPLQLPHDTFADLQSIESLELHHNNLQQLPVGIFRSQLKLKKLDLSCNELHNLSRDAFEGAISLAALNLSLNGIKSLHPDVFSLLTNLSEIYLNKNHFQTLPAELFIENRKLAIVQMVNNRAILSSLPPALLANQPSLQEVHITYTNDLSRDIFDDIFVFPYTNSPIGRSVVRMRCGMSEIPGDLLTNSRKITGMTLADNQFVTLPATLLKGQDKLYLLELTRNKLQYLPDELFNDTSDLNVLLLSYNQLTEITDNIFASLVNLKCLWMNNNHLMTINANAFSRNTNIIDLNMEYNRLSFGDPTDGINTSFHEFLPILSPLQYLWNLETLNLCNNSVQYIYDDWKNSLDKLIELNLSYNNITSLDFYDLEFSTEHAVLINMDHNQIKLINFTGIEWFTQELATPQLENIDLNNNPIVCDCNLWPFVEYLQEGFSYLPDVKLNFIIDNLFCEEPDDMADSLVRDVQPKSLLCPIDSKHCPLGCKCWERSCDSVLIVNCSNADLVKVPSIPHVLPLGLQSIELHIENNYLLKLPSVLMYGYADVTQIYAAGNLLYAIDVDNLPENLTYLDLSRNRFNRLNTGILNYFNPKRSSPKISLAENPWNCDCENLPFMQFVQTNFAIITDVDRVYCAVSKDQTIIEYLLNNDVCQVDQSMIITLTVSIITVGFLLALCAALYYKYQIEIKVWMYKYRICICLVNEEELDKDKKYDAFVSYSHKDEEFIALQLVPELENGPIPFRLCIHVRDFIVGEYIPDQIVQGIEDSKRTIVVLSRNFIESVWARMEFRLAHQAALNEGRTRVIVIVYSDIGDTDSLDSDLKAYLKMNTYLKWGDPWFWDKLRYAMPHSNWKPRKASLPCGNEMTTSGGVTAIKIVPQ